MKLQLNIAYLWRAVVLPLIIVVVGCQNIDYNKTPGLAYDTLLFGSYSGTSFPQNIASLQLKNQDGSHIFKLHNNKTQTVQIEVGRLENLDIQLVSTNSNVAVEKVNKSNFKLHVNKKMDEENGYDGRLALLNTYKESGYLILRRDTLSSSSSYIDSEPFDKLDTVAYYQFKIE